MSESSGEIEKRGGTPDVPHLIRAGGEWAVLAYREFLDNPNWSAAKRTVSRNVLGRFCRWAEARGLTLESISASEVKAYFAETPEGRYLAPVGDLLRRLAAAGVVTGKPVRRKAMRKKATAVPEIIRAAGERAVAAYREILDDPKWSAGTRRLYGRRARRFFRWAEARGLTLETIAGADAAAYAAEIAARRIAASGKPGSDCGAWTVPSPGWLRGDFRQSVRDAQAPLPGSKRRCHREQARSGRSKSCGGMASAPTSWARKSPGPRPRS